MITQAEFIEAIRAEFPDDRLTYQKGIPTIHPQSASEATAFLKLVNKHRRKTFITGFGNNLAPMGKSFEEMVVVRTDRLNQVHEISEPKLFMKVGAGFPVREARQALAPKGLFFAPEKLPYVGSFGGAAAVGLSGQLRGNLIPFGKYLLQAEIVTAAGEVIAPGSATFKGGSEGDFVKAFSPSWGLFGLIVSLTVRVLPTSEEHEYAEYRMLGIDRTAFRSAFDPSNKSTDAEYLRKIKARFDPAEVLPIVDSESRGA